MKKSPRCKHCEAENHYSYQCFQAPKKALRTNKRPRQRGKQAILWAETRTRWLINNPGPWVCYLCSTYLDVSNITLDHVQSRSSAPELRHETSNLRPCCWKCNYEKGSKSVDKMLL